LVGVILLIASLVITVLHQSWRSPVAVITPVH
jgi:hypothetical protein